MAVMATSSCDLGRDEVAVAGNSNSIRVLHRSSPFDEGRTLSLYGFGTASGLPATKRSGGRKLDVELAGRMIRYAYQHGVNFYDTAYTYQEGESEVLLGNVLTAYPRDTYYLCDKMPGWLVHSRLDAERIFAEQLKRLRTDYFDLYMLHNVVTEEEYERVYEKCGVLQFLKEQKAAGKIRHLGISFHGRPDVLKRVLDRERWECVILMINAIDWEGPNATSQTCALCEEYGVPVVVMEPLAHGRLAKLNPSATAILKKIRQDATPANWGFRFAASAKPVVCVLSATTRFEHLQENVRTFSKNFVPLTGAEKASYLSAVREEFHGERFVPCTGCRYCMPCPYGIDIPGIFSWWNQKLRFGGMPVEGSGWKVDLMRRRFLREYFDRFRNRTGADYCTGCGRCATACPQWQFEIPAELDRIAKSITRMREHSPNYGRPDLVDIIWKVCKRFGGRI